MEFSEFANLLFPMVGTGDSTSAFTKTLFESISTEEGYAVLADCKPNTYKAYFNGHTKITKLSQRILVFLEPEIFPEYFSDFSDATMQSICDSFQPYVPDIGLHNAGEKLAALFASIIKDAASTKKKGTPRGTPEESPSANQELNDSILRSGKAVADAWSSAINQLLDDDKRLLERFKSDSDDVLRYIIEHDPSGEATSITLADEIATVDRTWQVDLQKIKDNELRNLVIDTLKVLDEYTYYISDRFLRVIPDRGVLWFRNESLGEGDQLREVLRPQTVRLRKEIAELYKKLFPIPEDNGQGETEKIEAEVVDDEEPSGAAKENIENKKITVIQRQTNVVQNGENNFNLTNNGTMNFKF